MSEYDHTAPSPPQAKRDLKAAATSSTELHSPLEHAKALGAHKPRQPMRPGDVAVSSVNGQSVDMSANSWQHNAAAALHGWAEHEHNEAKPIELSLDDYKKALLAASVPVVRAAADAERSIKKDDKSVVNVKVLKGEVIDLRRLQLTTYDLANAGIPFTAAEEPHPGALSKHAAHVKNAEANNAPLQTVEA